ncbi:MAG: pitrilysin family protein [Saprospiraceae bacterium]
MQFFQKKILDNGLVVIGVPSKRTSMACVSVLYKVGSRNEVAGKTGIAHLFEHLMFSNCGEGIDFDELMQSAGGDSNAFTTPDTTQYYNVAPSAQLELMIDLESRRMSGFHIKKKEFRIQQRVVIEEFSENYLNNPYGMFSHQLMPLAYQVHPYQWPVIGRSREEIGQLEYSDAMDFHQKYYTPDNAVIVISGNIDVDQAFLLTDRYFSPIPSGHSFRPAIATEPEQLESRKLTIPGPYPEEALYIAFHSSGRDCKDFYALDFATDILAEGRSSLLYSRLKKEQMLFSSLDCYMTTTFDPGLIIFEGKLNKGVGIERGENAFLELLQSVKENPVSSYLFEKYMNKNESAYLASQIGVVSQALNFSYSEWLGDVNLVNTELQRYREIQTGDIQASFNKYFLPERANYLYYPFG